MLCNYCERGGGAERRNCEGCANVLSVHNCVGYVFVAKFFNLCNGRAFCCYSNSVLWVRGYVFGLNKRLFVAVCLFGLDKNKRQAMLFSLAFCVVGMTGFEPATPTSRT